MKIFEIGTGYTSIPAQISAATEIIIEKLSEAFLDNGVQTEVLDIMDKDRKDNALPIIEIKIPYLFRKTDLRLGIFHKLKRVVYSCFLAKKLNKIIKSSEEKCVLHFHNQYNLFMFLCLTSRKIKRKAIITYTVHSGIWNQPWDSIKRVVRRRFFQEVFSMKKADRVFLLNTKTQENIVRHLHIDQQKTCIIANGVDTAVYKALSDEDIVNAKREYGLDGKKVLMQIGSVTENKGQLRVIEALEGLFKKYDDFVYAYAGGIVSAEYQERIQRYASEKGYTDKVIYLGMIRPGEDLNEIYNIADATIVASGFESFSLVTIESLAAGTPVFINNSVPFEYGNGCNAYSIENLSEIIEKRVLRSSIKMEQRYLARSFVEENYCWKHIAKKYIEEMKQIG